MHGVDERFAALFPAFTETPFDLSRAAGQLFPSAIINETLERELGIEVGDAMLLNFRTRDDVPEDTLLGGKETAETVGSIRTVVTAIVPDANLGRFSLSPHQAFPPNAYVAVADLQAALDQTGKVNAVFVAGAAGSREPVSTSGAAGAILPAQTMLRGVLSIDDLGLLIEPRAGELIIESTEFVLRPNVAGAIRGGGAATRRLRDPRAELSRQRHDDRRPHGSLLDGGSDRHQQRAGEFRWRAAAHVDRRLSGAGDVAGDANCDQ